MCSSTSSNVGAGPSNSSTPPMCMCATRALLVQEARVRRRQPIEMLLCQVCSLLCRRSGSKRTRRRHEATDRPRPCRRQRATADSDPLRWPRPQRSCCSPRRAATAPASTGPCRRSSARSSSTARPSTCARRSCTTSTSSSSCASAARSSSSPRPRSRRARRPSSPPTASRRAFTRTPPRASST